MERGEEKKEGEKEEKGKEKKKKKKKTSNSMECLDSKSPQLFISLFSHSI